MWPTIVASPVASEVRFTRELQQSPKTPNSTTFQTF
jgi:hypothetical protein